MKRFLLFIALIGSCLAFSQKSVVDDLVAAFKTGNAAKVAGYFDNSVEINLPGKSDIYNKSQAEIILKEFFSSNEVKGFEVQHKGDNEGSQYCIGTLQTKNGNFRATLFLKQKGDRQLLQQIRIESK